MNSKVKGIIIDFVLLGLFGIIFFFGIYFLYEIVPTFPKSLLAFVFILLIPLVWGTAIFSIMGRKTLGHRIVEKCKKKDRR